MRKYLMPQCRLSIGGRRLFTYAHYAPERCNRQRRALGGRRLKIFLIDEYHR